VPKAKITIDGYEVIGLTGDDDPFRHGGGVIYASDRGHFWQFWASPSGKTFTVYTARVEDHVFRGASTYADPPEVAKISGEDVADLKKMSRSLHVKERAQLVQILMDVYGPTAIAFVTEALTQYELVQRWGPAFGYEQGSASRIDDDDYLIVEGDGYYDCGTVGARYLGRFETYNDALITIAADRSKAGSVADLFQEEAGELVKVEWNPRSWFNQRVSAPSTRGSRAKWRSVTRRYRLESRKTLQRKENRKNSRRNYASASRRRDMMARSRRGT
jgi:hypothetical protein